MQKSAFATFIIVFCSMAQTGSARGFPDCAGSARIAHVSGVAPNGVLAFSDGQRAVLEGIRLPQGAADRAGSDAARQALSALVALVKDRNIEWAATKPTEDRHGRLRAQIAVGGVWVQEALLQQGLARVALLPSHAQCVAQMYAAEEAARAAKRGLWALPEYAVRLPDGLAQKDRGTFQIVEGKVVSAAVKSGRAYINFSADWDRDFTVTITPEDMKVFRTRDVNPRDYAGKMVRVRGIIDWYHGPEIELMGPASVEVLN